jgi:phage shock protein A
MLFLDLAKVNKMKRAEVLELERIRKRIAEMEAQLNALRSWEADFIARQAAPKGAQTAP